MPTSAGPDGRLPRARIAYGVGSKNDPADPWGRSELVIEPDGRARLDQDTRGGLFAWTGIVTARTLERLWSALEASGFPAFPIPPPPPPAGSAMRNLSIGPEGPDAPTIFLPYHARVPGYADAFAILDGIIRQLGEDTVKVAPASAEPLVESTSRVTAGEASGVARGQAQAHTHDGEPGHHVPTFAESLLARWQELAESARTKLTRIFTDAVLAKLQADPFYSSFSAAPRVELLGASERDGVVRVHYIADHLNYCYAQSGSDWADHTLFAGDVTLRSGAPSEVRVDQVKHVSVSEREYDDGYDREPAVSSVRAQELARLAAAAPTT
jgi:hypothetical protein